MRYVPFLDDMQMFSCQQMTQKLWSDGRCLEDRYARLKALPKTHISMAGLVEHNGDVLCSLKRYLFKLRLQQKPLAVLGLGAIFTMEAHRNQRLATKLINIVLNEAKKAGARAALLFSDIGSTYYERFGFRALDALDISIDVSAISMSSSLLQVRAAQRYDVDMLINFFHNSFATNSCHNFRHREDWLFFRTLNGPVNDMIINDGSQDVGYVTFSTDTASRSLQLHEFFLAQEYHADLLAHLGAIAQTHGLQIIRGFKPYQTLTHPSVFMNARKDVLPMIRALDDNLSIASMPKEHFWFGSLDSF